MLLAERFVDSFPCLATGLCLKFWPKPGTKKMLYASSTDNSEEGLSTMLFYV